MTWKRYWIFMMRKTFRSFIYHLQTAFGGFCDTLGGTLVACPWSHYQPVALSCVTWVYLVVVWIFNVPQRPKCCVESQANPRLSQRPWWNDNGSHLPRSKLGKASLGLGSGPWRSYDIGSWKLGSPLMRLVLSTPRPLCAWSVMLSTHQVPFVQQCLTADFASWCDRVYRLCLRSLETVYEIP